MHKRKKGATYIHDPSGITRLSKRSLSLKSFASTLFSVLTVIIILFTTIAPTLEYLPLSVTAFADDDPGEADRKSKEKMDKALKEMMGEDDKKDDYGFESIMNKSTKDNSTIVIGSDEWADKRKTFSYVIWRFISIGYLNDVIEAIDPADNVEYKDGNYICDVNHPHSGTPLYHNCDIPRFTTEMAQDLISLISESGLSNARRHSNKLAMPSFGLPSVIVDEGVPADPESRNKKYTGLEIYGYNFKLSEYNGEWDHIKIMTSARLMANFGLMDKLKLGATAVIKGAVEGIGHTFSSAWESFKKGDVIGVLVSPFRGLKKGAATATTVIVDTSDLNIHNAHGWYRLNYPRTLYNARELTEIELSAISLENIIDYFKSEDIERAVFPEEWNLPNPPPGLTPPKGICVWTVPHPSNSPSVPDQTIMSNVDSNAECQKLHAEAKEAKPNISSPTYTPAQSLSDWKSKNAKYIEVANELNMDVNGLLEGNATTSNKVNSYRDAWSSQFEEAKAEWLQREQMRLIMSWRNLLTKSHEVITGFFLNKDDSKIQTRNFNAPYTRLVCTDEKGEDIKNGKEFTYLYHADGSFNTACKPVRPPIQGGFFGDGYMPDQKVEIDTRRELYSFDIVEILEKHPLFFGTSSIANSISSFNLSMSSSITRISNTFLNLSFSPILEFFGINDLIISFIEEMRESIFMALVMLVVGVSAMIILIQTVKNGTYKKGFIQIATMLLTLIISVALLEFPEKIVRGMDEAPAYVQAVVMGAIFDAGSSSDDILCNVSNESSSSSVTDFNGNPLPFSPKDTGRVLMCENWRVFALTPWVHAQFGTSFDNLYASGYGKPGYHTFSNTNQELVGDAAVNMGNGQKMHNWALYQMDVSSSGTTTEHDVKNPAGTLDTNFYRLVDLQFGPNNAAKSDTTYAQEWASNPLGRLITTTMGVFMSMAGAAVIILYSIKLIQVSVVSSLMLMALPFVLLIGINPGAGRVKLMKYVGTLTTLLVERIMLVTLLAILLRLLISTANSVDDFSLAAMISIILSIAFIIFRKDLMKLFNFGTENMAAKFTDGNMRDSILSVMPRTVQNRYNMGSAKVKGYIGGGVAGLAAGGIAINPKDIKQNLSYAKESAREASGASRQKAFNRERRRRGFGKAGMISDTYRSVSRETREDVKQRVGKVYREYDDLAENSGKPAQLDMDKATPKQLRALVKLDKNRLKLKKLKKKEDKILHKKNLRDLAANKPGSSDLKRRESKKLRKISRRKRSQGNKRDRKFRKTINRTAVANVRNAKKRQLKEEIKGLKDQVLHPIISRDEERSYQEALDAQLARIGEGAGSSSKKTGGRKK